MVDVGDRVLVVDDQPQVLRIVAAILTSHGYEVVTAECVSDAMQLMACGDGLRAAVLDVDLPDGVGFDLILPLRQAHSNCHIVMMTGRVDPGVIQRASDLGVGTVLGKPFDRTKLIQAIETGAATGAATETAAEAEAEADSATGRRDR